MPSQRKSWNIQRYTSITTARCLFVALVDQKDKRHESYGTSRDGGNYISWSLATVLLWTRNTALFILALQRIGKTCFITSQRKWPLETGRHSLDVIRRVVASVSYLSLTSDSLTSGHMLYFLGGYLDCQMQGLGYVVSVSLCLYPWIPLFLLCNFWTIFETLILVLFPQLGLA